MCTNRIDLPCCKRTPRYPQVISNKRNAMSLQSIPHSVAKPVLYYRFLAPCNTKWPKRIDAVLQRTNSCSHCHSQFRVTAEAFYSAFLAALLHFGAVVISVPFFSRSAAHRAAPTVFVNENRIEAIGTSSSNVATVPKAVYGPECYFKYDSFSELVHFLSWKYLVCAAWPRFLP